MAASWLTGLGVVAGLGYGLAGVASAPNPDSGMLTAAFVVPVVGGFVLYGALRSLLRKRVRTDADTGAIQRENAVRLEAL